MRVVRFIVGPIARLALPTCAASVGGPTTRGWFETAILLRLELGSAVPGKRSDSTGVAPRS